MLLKKISLGFIVLVAPVLMAKAQTKVNYEVSFIEPQAHYVAVKMHIAGLTKAYVDVKMPVWAPGSYLIREFSKNVEGFAATSGMKVLKTEKIKKNTWRVYTSNSNAVDVNYSVYAFEPSVRTAFIDASHAFLSPTGIFMYPDNQLALPSTVKVIPFEGWNKVSTGLEPVAGQQFTYTAKNYDILFDSPIEVGNQDVFEFTAAGVKHEVAMYGGGNYNVERLKVDMAKIVEQATAIYGENPNKHYTFIVHNFSRGGGGLEHLNSTVLGASRDDYASEEGYKGFLSLVAHEYHHLWNVKRLRPVALGPFDYENENYTTNLWVAEGFTAYYENKFMLRAGFLNPGEFVNTLTKAVNDLMNTPGSRVQSAAMSSFDAWIKYYRPDENSNNSGVSYYSKGEVVGLLMDLEIANATKGKYSLDDVMKAMYEQCKMKGKGYTDAEFKAMVEKISGVSFTNFWDMYVNGTQPIEYAKYLGYAGIKVTDENDHSVVYMGIANRKVDGHLIVISVGRNTSAWDGGVNAGDEVISVDGVAAEQVIGKMAVITSKKVGDVVTVKVKRDGIDKDIKVKLKANRNVRLVAKVDPDRTDAQLAVFKKWSTGSVK
ncbi:M61 family metallopeptidase [Pedobacter cryoconitis]|uniref:Putative metalloprotease with PDZ domain n=1 Tax=Pedobacter cryoconitis TaxID=188932 RepID=A0A7X0J816_9SPHI|nr:PDZ domain-containing protein [Pedobacter cryoconitis]MBB6501386.1 putative metalloprotease with PDZ domain [Pedobacter cryoconitis]